MNFRCSSVIHACPRTTDSTSPFDLKFFNLKDPVHPQFISHFVPTSRTGVQVKPHEMFLWIDPNNAGRAMLFLSTPTIATNPTIPNLMVVDISQVPDGCAVTEVARRKLEQSLSRHEPTQLPLRLHFSRRVRSLRLQSLR